MDYTQICFMQKRKEKYEDKYKYCMLFLDVVGPMTEQCDADKLSYRAYAYVSYDRRDPKISI